MKIYIVGFKNNASEHTGYGYYSNKIDMWKEIKKHISDMKDILDDPGTSSQYTDDDYCDFTVHNIEISKKGILDFLNRHASHPDNG